MRILACVPRSVAMAARRRCACAARAAHARIGPCRMRRARPFAAPPIAASRRRARRRRARRDRGRATGTRSPAARRSLSHAFLSRAARDGLRVAAPPAGRRAILTAWRGDALVGAMPLYAKTHSLRRVRVRLGVGRRLSPPRPPLLSEARRARFRSRRRRDRGCSRATTPRGARCSRAALARLQPRAARSRRILVAARAVSDASRGARAARRAGHDRPPRRAVPLGESGLSRLRRLPRRRSTTTSARR